MNLLVLELQAQFAIIPATRLFRLFVRRCPLLTPDDHIDVVPAQRLDVGQGHACSGRQSGLQHSNVIGCTCLETLHTFESFALMAQPHVVFVNWLWNFGLSD